MEAAKEYLAIYPFKNEELELAVNDVIDVTVPANSSQTVIDRPGWILGKNRRTGIEGYFPGILATFITFSIHWFYPELVFHQYRNLFDF